MTELLNAVNAVRAQARICGTTAMPATFALRWNAALASAAAAHATDLATGTPLGHISSNGATMADRANAAGYQGTPLAENIAAGHPTVPIAVAGWLASPDHCHNMMNANIVEMGSACRYNASSRYGFYWVINFGHP